MSASTTPRAASTKLVNKELKAMGLDAKLYRSPSGYYYWSGNDCFSWPSIYVFNLNVYTVQEVLDEVKTNLLTR